MRILFLSLCVPLPANNGQKMRTWAVLRALAEEGHKITFLSFDDPDKNPFLPELKKICLEVETLPLRVVNLSSGGDYLGRLSNVFSSQPYGIHRFASRQMRGCIAAKLNSGSFDSVFCETVFSLVNVPQTELPVILDNHNVEHLILERYLGYESNPVKRLYARYEALRLKRAEREAGVRSSLVLCCSETDRRHFAQLCPQANIIVAPNCVDLNDYNPGPTEEGTTVLYQGGMDWFPNRDAVEFFVRSVLPDLRRTVPGIRFVVAGRNPSAEFRQRFEKEKDVVFTGTVEDMRPVIASAAVCVVPLRIGSGTRLKILEAAAMGKAVVSTTVGAEGLGFRHGTEILLADDPARFGESTALLLQDSTLRAAMGKAARQRVEREYSLAALRSRIAEITEPGAAGKTEVEVAR